MNIKKEKKTLNESLFHVVWATFSSSAEWIDMLNKISMLFNFIWTH